MEDKTYDELLPEEQLILHDNCFTCKYRVGSNCTILNIRERKTYYDFDFVCDYHRLKNSGAFRRKRRKVKKSLKDSK